MKVQLLKDNELRIEPETEFEADWICTHYSNVKTKTFIKTGLTLTDIKGLQIRREDRQTI